MCERKEYEKLNSHTIYLRLLNGNAKYIWYGEKYFVICAKTLLNWTIRLQIEREGNIQNSLQFTITFYNYN